MLVLSIKVTVVVQKEDNWYVAKCLEESIDNLREALELYYEDITPESLNTPTFVTTMEVAI